MAFAFEKLVVCQKAVNLAHEIAALTENLPEGYGFLADELSRAALSIAAKIAEGSFALPFLPIIPLWHNHLWRYERECQIPGRRGGGSG